MSTFSNLTLRQLRTLLPSTEGISTPSEIWIGSNPAEILCSADLGDSRIDVYKNGFYTYTKGCHTCILRVDGFSRLYYDAANVPNCFVTVEEHEYLDYPYFIALSVNGENQWERNQQKRNVYKHDFYIEDDEWKEELTEPCFLEAMEEQEREDDLTARLYRALNTLTGRQRQIVTMYYFKRMTQEEIAETLLIPQSAVSVTLKRALENLKRHI